MDECTTSHVHSRGRSCAQSISKKRPSRFVILSESEESLARQRFFALAQNDRLRTASFDSQHVFFEMDCPLWAPCLGDRYPGVRWKSGVSAIIHSPWVLERIDL